jgi:hypothetical protein
MSEVICVELCCPRVGAADELLAVQRTWTARIEVIARGALTSLHGSVHGDTPFGTDARQAESSTWVESVTQRLR